MNPFRTLLAFLYLLAASLMATPEANAFAVENRVWDFFLGTVDHAGQNVSQVVELHREKQPVHYDSASEYAVAAKTPTRTPPPLAQAGDDLFVGTYNQATYWNKKTGLAATHTPHHVVQNAVSGVNTGQGITISIAKDLHRQTRTFGVNADLGNNRLNLAADVWDLRSILRGAGYDSSVVNTQLRELIRQNRAVGNVPVNPRTGR